MPRKSDPGPIPGAGPPPGDKDGNGVSIDENVLPKSIVTRLAKGVLPQNTNIQKDAVLALTKGATVFINYLCTAANENAVKANKKTIMPKDVLEAISQLELNEFRPRLEAELAKFEEITSEKRAAAKKAAKDKETSTTKGPGGSPGKTSPAHGSPTNAGEDAGGDGDAEADTPPPAKKRKANGKAAPVNGTSKAKKGIAGGKPDAEEDEDDVGDDKDDYQEDEDEEEVSDEEDAEDTQDIVVEDVVEDLDESEPREDEALDNGYDSD